MSIAIDFSTNRLDLTFYLHLPANTVLLLSKGLFPLMAVVSILKYADVAPPSGWKKRLESERGQSLKSICSGLNGKTPSGYVDGNGVPVVRSGDLV
jgi:hypothetical protein